MLARSFSIVLMGLAACSCTDTSVPDFAALSGQPTPAGWSKPVTSQFNVIGKHREPLAKFTLYFSGEPMKTCTEGDWKRAYPKDVAFSGPPLQDWNPGVFQPAYLISGQNLLIQLNTRICDSDAVLRGSLSDSGARGVFVSEGIFGGDGYGTFTAKMSVEK